MFNFSLTKSFSDGVFELSECLCPKMPDYSRGFYRDKKALARDVKNIEMDYRKSIRVVNNGNEKRN
ncbi:hypothetical protein [Succinivibrio dextrinosolvens]|uniref:Uncharacterized protein n=1 Tax=Succinivibrio dextrinosolvens DSM 3072 TaxID=1123324 RepID=A0A1T4VIZ7_9GAMM|nr:hypothetical protein [Succinivibrio dextrinosolvens]MBQ3678283.1 hypothetical protein [Succinivibrio sp.]SKA64919.1 hypothetical protein SAMN02745213_01597 [Succinivibrio dextrinosolvens DSM 3072]